MPFTHFTAMVVKKFSRNPNLINRIDKFFRSKMYHKKGLWVIKKKKGGKFPTHPKSTAVVAPPSTTAIKPPKYPADDVEKSLINKHKPKPIKLRASITPGTGLIILVGRFKEKRVVFLKQLVCSGLLLVSGSFKVNGVSLRRVNQAYVIATSTKVDVSGVKIDKIQRKFMLFLVFVVVDIVVVVHCQKKKKCCCS
ncbi:60S ribosomal protein L6-like [Capsicum chacoense]